jgi:predicted DNA-binding ribbon-helix-helix protein
MRYITGMQSKSTSVRVEEDAKSRLKRISGNSGVSVTKLITLATYLYDEHVRKTGNISIPMRTAVAESEGEYQTKNPKAKKP